MVHPDVPILLWAMPHGPEWLIIAFIALLLFGNRLPSVARSMGRGITEFKRGLKDPADGGDGDGDGSDDDAERDRLKSPKDRTIPADDVAAADKKQDAR